MVPAYNEEKNIRLAVENTVLVLNKLSLDHEIIIFNDYSLDNTGKIADEIALSNPYIKVVHNEKNMGLGYSYKTGIELATKKYYTMVTGENDALPESIEKLLVAIGSADIIIPYNENTEIRSVFRRGLSAGFTAVINFFFGLNVKYYLGPVVHRIDLLRSVNISTHSFAYQAEILVKLLKRGYSYNEVSVVNRKPTRKSSIFRFKNVIGICKSVIKLFYDIHIKKDI